MENLNVIIIEDDIYQIDVLKLILKKYCPEVKSVTSAKNVEDGTKLIRNHPCDVIFLDINLGEESGFDILKTLSNFDDKEIIINSSQREHALDAFKYLVTDYILKPLTIESVFAALDKAQNNIALKKAAKQEPELEGFSKPIKKLAISSLDEVSIISLDDIVYLKSDGRYTMFYLNDNTTKMASKNLGEYEKLLEKSSFLRIHHSYLANMDFAQNVHKKDGTYLEMGAKNYLPISKRKIDSLYRYLNIK